MLDFADKTLNQSAFSIAPGIVVSRRFGIGFGRDHHLKALGKQYSKKFLRTMAAVRRESLKVKVNGHIVRFDDVVALSGGHSQPQGIPKPIESHMVFSAKTATTAPQGL